MVQARGNGSSYKRNSSGSGKKWSDAGNGRHQHSISCAGRAMREREESGVPPAVLASSSRRMELPFTEMWRVGQGQEADLWGRQTSVLDLGI